MNIKAYIESGLLEQYVLRMTSVIEDQEVERYAKQYPAVKKEIGNIEAALFKYAGAFAITPPLGLKERILNNLDDAPIASGADNRPKPNAKSSNWEILALIATVLLSLLTYNYYSKSNTLKQENQELDSKYQELKRECERKTELQNNKNKQIAMLRDANSKPIRMKGTPLSPNSEAVVYWNAESKSAFLDIASLPAPTADKQYQLWAIVDGAPVDMGVFDLPTEADTFLEVQFIEKPQAFAVTLEPRGGVVSPTMEQMYVIGNVI